MTVHVGSVVAEDMRAMLWIGVEADAPVHDMNGVGAAGQTRPVAGPSRAVAAWSKRAVAAWSKRAVAAWSTRAVANFDVADAGEQPWLGRGHA